MGFVFHLFQHRIVARIAIVLTMYLSSCFTPISDPIELPYEEKIVVRGILIVGDVLNDIQISRTLPPLEVFTYNKIFIANAKASVTVDGQTFPLTLQTSPPTTTTAIVRSLYHVPNLRVQAGKTYFLNVEWENPSGKILKATSATTTPLAPRLDSMRVLASFIPNRASGKIDTIFATEAFVQPRATESMRVGTQLLNSTGQVLNSRGYGDAFYFEATKGTTLIRSNNWTFTTATRQVMAGILQSRAVVETYDAAYYDYYKTRNRSGQPSPLNPGGPNIDWNVSGDGIGMFIGMAQVQRVVPVRQQNQ